MSKNLAIKINKLFKSYDDVKAVQGIDLEINKGEFYGLLGPNALENQLLLIQLQV